MSMRLTVVMTCILPACAPAQWTDTFTGQDTRALPDSGTVDDTGAVDKCTGLAMSKAPVQTITVTFPGHGTAMETIHVATSTATCDMSVDTDQDDVLFVSDASACAPLLAPGMPGMSSATASSAGGGPNDLQFQWVYSTVCAIVDDYALSKK